MSIDTNKTPLCPHCGSSHQGICPRIKSVEYENGKVKRVEYNDSPRPDQPPEEHLHLAS